MAANRLVTRKPGYVLEVQAGELDQHRFEQLLAEARVAYRNQQLDHCLLSYRAAHQLWRGSPFAGVPTTPIISAATVALTELHVTSLEELFRVALQCDAGEDLVVDLVKVVAANPLREILITQLMRALHRAGRTADALALCRRTRQLLGDELGIGPSRQLQQTERGILRGERDPGDPWVTPVPPHRTTAVRHASRR